MRGQVQAFLKLFPHDGILLAVYAWLEGKSHTPIDDRVRHWLRDIAPVDRPSVAVPLRTLIFAIAHELRSGTVHSALAAFERALDRPEGRQCASLWIAYVRFAHARRAELEPQRRKPSKDQKKLKAESHAKAVFYRAMAHCPGSKAVAMEAFTTLVKEMESSELRGLFDAMVDRGLRIRVDLEKFRKQWSARE